MLRYPIVFEEILENGFEGWYYAHVPALGLTTHGEGIRGARVAMQELLPAWLAEKREAAIVT